MSFDWVDRTIVFLAVLAMACMGVGIWLRVFHAVL